MMLLTKVAMNFIKILIGIVLNICFLTTIQAKDMYNNTSYLNKANEMIQQFKNNPKTDETYALLNKAVGELEKIDFEKETNIDEFNKVRHGWLLACLKVIQLLDQYYKPNFSPDKPYTMTVFTPMSANDVSFGNTSSSDIKDSKIREEYEKKIQKNEEIRIEIFLQQRLAELDSSESGYDIQNGFPYRLREKIKRIYSFNAKDNKELQDSFEKYLDKPYRRKEFEKLINY